jgi:hypothetical protein
MKIAGALALVFYAIHAIVYYAFIARMPEGALWACHVGCAVVGIGCLSRRSLVVSVGTLWLVYGSAVWLIDLASGSNLIPTSLCTHVGGVLVAAYAVRTLGWTRGASLVATVALFALLGVTRLVTPPRSNINLVFSVTPGWEQRFPRYSTYFLFLFVTAFLVFIALDAALTRFFTNRGGVAQSARATKSS